MKKLSLLTVSLSLLFFSIVPSFAQDLPTIETSSGVQVLVLPQSVKDILSTQYQNYRLPNSTDVFGIWKNEVSGSSVPYAAWGDFNSDNYVDITILLIGAGNYNSNKSRYLGDYKVLIFNGNANGYAVSKEMGTAFGGGAAWAPQDISIELVKKGVVINDSDAPINKDRIRYAIDEMIDTLIYWDGTEYKIEILSNSS